ncbi:ATP-binding protein [Streptomyces sp. NPDC059533]|uniref:ATP-binding protein n=1 Tax=unclassified Streptomyces TaxID=2593676 RepID=UPI0036B64C1C
MVREETNSYDASHIKVLEGWEAVRKRPGMYIGSTGERGLRQMVFGVADRAVNEVSAGRAGSVEVVLTVDGGVTVADDGPGIPVDGGEGADGPGSGPGLEVLLTQMKFRGRSGGRHDVMLGILGAELPVVNALSGRMRAEVRCEGVRWVQEYARGVAVTPLTEAGKTAGRGTTIGFWPDAEVFETVEFSFETLAERFRELTLLNRGLEISLTDRRHPGEPRSQRFRFEGGARDFVDFLDDHGAPASEDTFGFEYEDPRMEGTVDVAFRWCGSHGGRILGFANSRPTAGGTHERGFREGVAEAIDAHARERLLPAATAPESGVDPIGEGMTAVVSVKLDHPEFEGAARNVLVNSSVRVCVREAVQERLGRWLEEDPERAAAFVGRLRT